MLAAVLLLSLQPSAAWLAPASHAGCRSLTLRSSRSPARMSSMMPPDEGAPDEDGRPNSRIDWDGAWQSEVAKRKAGTAEWRPEGRDAVSEQQIVEAKAKLAVTARPRLDQRPVVVCSGACVRACVQADEAAATLQQATADWRFWFGVIALVSVVTAVLGHSSTEQVYSV